MTNISEASPSSPKKGLWAWVTPYRRPLLLVLLLGFGAQATSLAQPLATRAIFDSLETGGNLFLPISVLLCLALVGLAFNYVGEFRGGKLRERASRDLREEVFHRILGARVTAVEGRSRGDLLSRTSSDMRLVQQSTIPALVDLIVVPLTVAAGVVLMLVIDPVLAVVVVSVLGVAAVAQYFLFRQMEHLTEVVQEHLGRATGVVNRALSGLRTVKSARAERREVAAHRGHCGSVFRSGIRLARREALTDTTTYAAVDLTFLVVLAVGAVRLSTGDIGVGDLIAILLYVIIIEEPLESLVGSVSELATGLGALRRVQELLDLPREEPPSQGQQSPAAPWTGDGGGADGRAGEVRSLRLAGVSVSYGDRTVLRDADLVARPGITTLVGPSGAGKTTVLSVLQRFIDPDHGQILLDDRDIHAMPLATLRRLVAYVQQDAPVLGATIEDTVRYGAAGGTASDGAEPGALDGLVEQDERDEQDQRSADLSTEHVWRVLEQVGLAGWVRQQPAGLATEVGENGARVSGGQRQRLALARALLQDRPVLLLDEATSQLDPPNEERLVALLARHQRHRIITAVTHRPALALHSDQVVLFRDGQVHTSGTHGALLGDPFYRDLIGNGFTTPPEG